MCHAVTYRTLGRIVRHPLAKIAVENLGLHDSACMIMRPYPLKLKWGLVIRPAKKRYTLDDLAHESRDFTAPEPLDDTPMGDEQL